jgi:hypothetical protein
MPMPHRHTHRVAGLALYILATAPVFAAAQDAPSAPSAQCLSAELKDQIRKKKESPHKTVLGEREDPLDPDYFLGRWTMEWIAPDSPLGPAADITGTMTMRHVSGCYYEGELSAKGPEGPYTSKLQLIYDLERRYLVWIEADSRGFTGVRIGPVGGDPGGYYTYFWQQPVVKVKRSTMQLQGTFDLRSPITFNVRQQISINGQPYENFGTAKFTKEPR